MSGIDDRYVTHLEGRVREKAQDVANHLREVADAIERDANRGKLDRLPASVMHTLSWGLANANAAAVGYAFADLVEVREAILRELAGGES
ncbi:hypothetical protein [Gordonia alkanivorans]|uniref:hypothetical protein n=1 Tax=Gordonia alkanivorans TaxID=84096 RepID=UPI0024B7404D|nr:hypothetical protein [Gordonia alkanivorans]MDJ0010142.1 hypothetical protein [Gordonia alkanivorans]MDJ0495668.1 hypothetical protein [Gordonia alkanivorans]